MALDPGPREGDRFDAGVGHPAQRALLADLQSLAERAAEPSFARGLYQGLAGREWRKDGGEPVSLSWSRAEEAVNELRREAGREPLELAQTGGEGELGQAVAASMESLGWTSRPLATGEHQPDHAGGTATPPPRREGEREAPERGEPTHSQRIEDERRSQGP